LILLRLLLDQTTVSFFKTPPTHRIIPMPLVHNAQVNDFHGLLLIRYTCIEILWYSLHVDLYNGYLIQPLYFSLLFLHFIIVHLLFTYSCVCERQRERGRKTDRQTDRQTDRNTHTNRERGDSWLRFKDLYMLSNVLPPNSTQSSSLSLGPEVFCITATHHIAKNSKQQLYLILD